MQEFSHKFVDMMENGKLYYEIEYFVSRTISLKGTRENG